MKEFYRLDFVDKIGLIGSIASIVALLIVLISLSRKIKIGQPKKFFREFVFVYKGIMNISLTIIIAFTYGIYIYNSYKVGAPPFMMAAVSAGYLGGIFLAISFFIKQNKPIMRNIILSHMKNIIDKSNGDVSAIKFDIDLIVAINDYSHAVGNSIVRKMKEILRNKERSLKSIGVYILSIEIPESDEIIWIIPNISEHKAADIADEIRREMKRELENIPNYNDARSFVISKLTSPPLTEEEKEGIGTISAGVAKYNKGVETLLSDISSAVKECKFRGRNRTIIYQRESESIVRDH